MGRVDDKVAIMMQNHPYFLYSWIGSAKLGGVEVHALAGVSLNIERGEYLALMGSSGSGKSTLMNTLGCIDRPTSGSYLLDGEEVVNITPFLLVDSFSARRPGCGP